MLIGSMDDALPGQHLCQVYDGEQAAGDRVVVRGGGQP